MTNRCLDWIAAALVMAVLSLACASPQPDAYQRALDCPTYDCGEDR